MVIKLQTLDCMVFLVQREDFFAVPACISFITNCKLSCQNIRSHLQGVYHRRHKILLPLPCFSFGFEESFISSLGQCSWNQWMLSLWARRSCSIFPHGQTYREELLMGFCLPYPALPNSRFLHPFPVPGFVAALWDPWDWLHEKSHLWLGVQRLTFVY